VRIADCARDRRTIGRSSGAVTSVAFAPAGGLVASGAERRHRHDLDAVGFRESLRGHSGAIVGLVFSRTVGRSIPDPPTGR
jgi:hypothetical protein